MKLVTIQASAIKSTFEVLKDILNDVNIYFKPDGMHVVTLDTARTSLIDMFLSADNFEFMDIEIVSEVKKTCTKFQLKLLDINESRIEVPDVVMTSVTTLPSMDFQRLCRDMSNIGTDIEITRVGKQLKLKCEGDFATQETNIECPDETEDEYVCVCATYARKWE
jgi:proliferating cell nuclear antigen